jgi:hypothetical protein
VGSYPTICRLPLAPGSKRPILFGWSSISPDDAIIPRVFADSPHCGTGLRLDHLVVVDCDSPERVAWWIEQGFPTDFMSRGNPERRSFWYRLPEDVETRSRRFPDWEIRSGPGAHCAVPPTIHPKGWRYEWLGPPVDEDHWWEIPEAPISFLESVHSPVEHPVGDGAGWDVVMEGEGRDNFLAAAAGFLRAKGASVAAVRSGIAAWNHVYCEPRLPPADLDRIAQSSGRWEPGHELQMADEDITAIDDAIERYSSR